MSSNTSNELCIVAGASITDLANVNFPAVPLVLYARLLFYLDRTNDIFLLFHGVAQLKVERVFNQDPVDRS